MTAADRSASALKKLQLLQEQFDTSRGFNFERPLATLTGVGGSGQDLMLQFTALALCGEVGELANRVKKRIRAKLLNQPGDHNFGAGEELGDIAAYLLKLANVLQQDLGIRYLQQMCENALRFPSVERGHAKIVTIAGPSGAGKSTTVANLAKAVAGARIYIENPSANAYLPMVLGGENDAAFSSQNWFLKQEESFFQDFKQGEAALLDQDPAGIVLVYSRKLWDEGKLTTAEYESLLIRLLQLEIRESRTLGHRFTVFLDAPAQLLCQRTEARTKTRIGLTWFEDVRARFLDLQRRTPRSLLIDTYEHSPAQVTERVTSMIQHSS